MRFSPLLSTPPPLRFRPYALWRQRKLLVAVVGDRVRGLVLLQERSAPADRRNVAELRSGEADQDRVFCRMRQLDVELLARGLGGDPVPTLFEAADEPAALQLD